ncbi:dTDP-4-dehydrorhamnose 3,5-epimerase [Paenibacillus sp. PsM32]|uniref:dTDP-4-dehydrorhamnose 3,5-epimerase n=1 Tax=Paenibacillus sp. PsM32 TaxID=3030536 RepID=UPI00263B4949|nr:dTDP-4-dehydrorhamnose 3,5-epimerase [Paenibacillus sp. PsM32]MDN4620959.1 dTDP-4-dehydrorhamnose 3,5-epimerase [Paenibacillus sp. PsM32]
MKLIPTFIPGCHEIAPKIVNDIRGSFVKTFHENWFKDNNLESSFKEQYFSVSKKNVLRGLHFQAPPHDHVKLVYCVHGEIFDVVLDIRKGSPTYGHHHIFYLDSVKSNIAYIPRGFAHGFYVKSEFATVVYNVSSVYNASYDKGIHWDSANILWPKGSPIISERDENFMAFEKSEDYFLYTNENTL